MDSRNMINRVSSQKTLYRITIKNKSDVVDEAYDFYIQGLKNINVIQKMKSLYNYLRKSYRNEYFCKNTILSKLLLGRHSINATTAPSEMPIGENIVDFILLNGEGIVYEIKTELDRLDRLDNQTNDYYEVFNYIIVITNGKHLSKVMARYKDTTVGILVLITRNTLGEVQKSKENNSPLNAKTVYNSLRKEERKRIIAQNHMDVPTYNDLTECDVLFDVFKEIPMTKLYNSTISGLKKGGNMKEYKDEFLAAPAEVKSLLYFAKMTKKNRNRLYHFLKEDQYVLSLFAWETE